MRRSLLFCFVLLLSIVTFAQGQDGVLAPCTTTDLAALAEIKSGYDALMTQAGRTTSTVLLRYLAERQYEWRLGLNDDLPYCAEAIEIGWLMSQVTADAVSAAAFTVDDKQTGWMRQPMETGQARLNQLFEELTAALENVDATTAATEVDIASDCSDGQLETLAPHLLIGFQDTGNIALEIITIEDFVYYAFGYLEWRNSLWTQLPHCSEAIEFGLMMNQINGDFVNVYLMKIAGLEDDDNPAGAQITAETYRFEGVVESVVVALDRNIEVKTYYVSGSRGANIRSCGSTACDILTVFEHGKEMRIIDDSSDWYEIRFHNGETGFIADFLASANAPE